MMTITVFTKPGCPDCHKTTTFLDNKDIEHNELDVFDNPEALDFVKNTLGVMSMPVVLVHEGPWWEFRPQPNTALHDQPGYWVGLHPYRLMQLERQRQPVGA